jgi:cysteine synthase B
LQRLALEEKLPKSVKLFAKAEWFNPSGSVKDRPALNIIRTAEWQGKLRQGITLLDSTSGNMGISYAMFGATRGYKVKLVLPENVSPERLAILRAYGAEIVSSDPLEGSDGAILVAREIARENPGSYYFANQYNNPANWQAHYFTTANEIWRQTNGKLTHFVAGLGTSGTFVGVSRRVKELNPHVKCISVQPDNPFNGLEGLKHMPTAIQPAIYDPYLADKNIGIRTESAYEMARKLARIEGLFVGLSAAAAVVSVIEIARELSKGMIITLLPDNGYKYLSERYLSE